MTFSDVTNGSGIVQQVRDLTRTDSTQWATQRIVNSVNNWLDKVTGYAIGADSRFRWDDTNHSKLPEGTTNIVANQSDYSFLTDEQGNTILTLIGVSALPSSTATYYEKLTEVDRSDANYDVSTFGQVSGTASQYDKISDNIIRLDMKPANNITSGLKFFFQRSPSYFTSADTTKQPGCAPILHRGFVIAAAYDCALTLGLPNFQALAVERALEDKKMVDYFQNRNEDVEMRAIPEPICYE